MRKESMLSRIFIGINKNITMDKKYVILLSITFFLFVAVGKAADTLHVVTHDRVTVVTDPAKGSNTYRAWGLFPSSDTPVRSIKLKVRFGCPGDMRCADWDYKDHITIRRTGGADGVSQDYEIGRMLTPYGGAFGKDWQFGWEVDVTDFSMLLQDSVEIEYDHTGYEPNEDRGWTVTLDFEIVVGQPAWQPVAIQKIYDGYFLYGDSTQSIEEALKPITFTTKEETDFVRLRVVQTGHGMDKPDNCAEFCNKYRELWVDGQLIEKRDIWKHCGDNPLYPQAGTWIYDRANWCPGNLMQPAIYNLPLEAGKEHTIDLNMQTYVASDPSAHEAISAYIIEYRSATAENDVRIEDIVSPSSKDIYARKNPTSMHPEIKVKNMGSATVQKMDVRYGIAGKEKARFRWKGQLAPGEISTISLPGTVNGAVGRNIFEVSLSQPNGKRDPYPADNKMTSHFEAVPIHDNTIVIYLLTNREPTQTGYLLKDSHGTVIKERTLGSLEADTCYLDTLQLLDGNYRFVLLDSAGDGLEFWANRAGGRGKARLLNKEGAILKDFESDFGSSVQYSFIVGAPVSPVEERFSFDLYPTRTKGKTTLDYYANFAHDVVVQIITDPGEEIVETHTYFQLKGGMFTYDLSRFPKSRYYLKVMVDGEGKFKKRIRVKEY